MDGTQGWGLQLRRSLALPLYANSRYLVVGPVVSSALGFAFWWIAARSVSAAEVGVVGAAIASVNLLIALTDLGLSTAIIHHAAADRRQAPAVVNTSIGLGWPLMLLATAVFLLGIPFWSPGLMSIRNDVAIGGLFVSYAVFNHVLALQDAAMLSQGDARFIFWRTLACNVPSVALVMPLVLVVGGEAGLLAAYGLPNIVIGLVAGLLVLPRVFPGYRFLGHVQHDIVLRIAGYGLANHVGSLLWGLPAYVLPLIAISALGAEETGPFYIVWAIANLVLIAPRMVTYALFAEVSQAGADLGTSSRRSLVAIAAISGPAVVLLWIGGDLVLGLFGPTYVNETLLRLLLLSAVPFTINSMWFVVLRARGRLREIILFSAFVATSVVALAIVLVQTIQVEGLAAAWLLGHGLAAIGVTAIAGRSLVRRRRITATT